MVSEGESTGLVTYSRHCERMKMRLLLEYLVFGTPAEISFMPAGTSPPSCRRQTPPSLDYRCMVLIDKAIKLTDIKVLRSDGLLITPCNLTHHGTTHPYQTTGGPR